VFYLAADQSIMGVPVNPTASGFQAEAPAVLCRSSLAPPAAVVAGLFEVSADGRRFLILAPSAGSRAQGIDDAGR